MKKALIVFAVIWMMIACLAFIGQAIQVKAQEQSSKIVLPDSSLMLVLYLEKDDQFLQAVRGAATFEIEGNKMYLEGRVVVNDMGKVGYSVHPYKRIPPKYEWDEELGESVEVPQYMWDLGLEAIIANNLPRSQHIAKLVDIDPSAVRPATVVRKFLGETYQVKCLVSQSAKDMYLEGTLSIGDYVVVSFIDEIPDSREYNIAVIVDKVWESW